MPREPENASEASVLVVDDETGVREALRIILGPEFRVVVAESGEQALEVVRGQHVDVVVLDLQLPGMNGWETFERIGEIKPEAEIVIATGHGSYAEAVKALHLHAFDFMTKPFDVNQVLQVVHRAATSAQTRRQGSARKALHALAAELSAAINGLSRTASGKLTDVERVELERIGNLARTVLGFSGSS